MDKERSWEAFHEFLLYGTLDRFTNVLARYELFKNVISLPGDIVEGGVYRGAGLLYWAKLLQIFSPISKRKVIGFDTFEGYSLHSEYTRDMKTIEQLLEKDSHYNLVTPESILEVARSLELEHRIEIVKGDASKTIEEYVRKTPGFRISLLNLDFDTHDPTATALEFMYPLVVPKGIVILDEYAIKGWGESDAVDRYFEGKKIIYHSIPWVLTPTAYVFKN